MSSGIIAIIQARMNSTRLPGKVLADINGMTMLSRVINRTKRSELIEDVVVATTDNERDNEIVSECNHLGISVFRGSEDDVLDRYYNAAKLYSAEVIVRICSDSPLIDPAIIDRIVQVLLDDDADYVSNSIVRTYPLGLDTEAFHMSTLEKAWKEASMKYQRVHVTPYIYENKNKFKVQQVTNNNGNYSYLRWTVDTYEDLALMRIIYSNFCGKDDFSWLDVVKFMEQNPDLKLINNHVRQKSIYEC